MKPSNYHFSEDGTAYRDLNGNGHMDPFEDPRLSPEQRTEDLLARLSLDEKIGLMFQTVIEAGPGGTLLEAPGAISKSPTSIVVLGKHISHFNVHALSDARSAARWMNQLQALAAKTPHGIPITVSSDPRHAFAENVGVGFSAGPFSQWPEPLGLAAIDDVEVTRLFAEVVRAEYLAVGIRAALHPQIDLATEPRWGRQLQTFGRDPDRASAHTAAYLAGLQGATVDSTSVACTAKHFPGGGPQQGGEDAHFPYGREQVYPGGRFHDHLAPFETAVRHGVAGMMPYYGMPVNLVLGGEEVEEVGFGYNRQILQGLLRERLGFDGVILTDWELVNDNIVEDQVLPARAWGVEHLDAPGRMLRILEAGADQFGGEEAVETLRGLVDGGLVPESRIDESARRVLLVKFRLGLFDDPFVDEDDAMIIVGNVDHRAVGERTQSESVTVLENREIQGTAILPLRSGLRIYVEGVDPDAVQQHGEVVTSVDDAEIALVRIAAPYEPRDDLFLESFFHQGSLDLRPGLVYHINAIAEKVPLVLDVTMDRAAVLTPVAAAATALTVTFGVSDAALLRALSGEIAPVGKLPINLPRSMSDVREVQEDVGLSATASLYPAGHRVPIASGRYP